MTTQEKTPLNIYQKLVEVRKGAMYVKKDSKGHNFNYANTADLLGCIRPKMDELGLLLVPNVESLDIVQMPKLGKTVDAMKMVVSFTWINADAPSEQIKTHYTFYEDRITGCQGVGSLLTYAERYHFYKFFNVATDSDAPEEFYRVNGLSAMVSDQEKEQKKEEKPSVPQRTLVQWRNLSKKFWARLLETNPQFKLAEPDAFFLYLRDCQRRSQGTDILSRLEGMAKDPEVLMNGYNRWSKENLSVIDSGLVMLSKELAEQERATA